LLHETNINLGTGATIVLDNPGWQYAIEYGAQKNPTDVHALFQQLGVTHVFTKTEKSKGSDSLAGDIRFFDYVRRYGSSPMQVAGGILIAVGEAPSGDFDESVAVLSCGNDYQPGLYRIADLKTPPFGPRMKRLPAPRTPATIPDEASALVGDAEFVVMDPGCFAGNAPDLRATHALLVKRSGSRAMKAYEIWVRGELTRPGRATPGKEKEPEVPDDDPEGP
jgi:hypothetical protein